MILDKVTFTVFYALKHRLIGFHLNSYHKHLNISRYLFPLNLHIYSNQDFKKNTFTSIPNKSAEIRNDEGSYEKCRKEVHVHVPPALSPETLHALIIVKTEFLFTMCIHVDVFA